jgi:uncharacterized protein (TIGR02118 family)
VVKLVYCICRKPGLSGEAFIRYWAEVHAPIGARIPGLRRLEHSYTIAAPADRRAPDYDGMAELRFDDLAALLILFRQRGAADPLGRLANAAPLGHSSCRAAPGCPLPRRTPWLAVKSAATITTSPFR